MRAALQVTGPQSGLVFDVKTVKVSGKVTRNGTTPVITGCWNATAYVLFHDPANDYAFATWLDCSNTHFTFSLDVPPGVYDIGVRGHQTVTNLPDSEVRVATGLRIQ